MTKPKKPAYSGVLVGKTEAHLSKLDDSDIHVHRDMIAPLHSLQKKARAAGFELKVVRGFRGFSAQQNIWNLKASGKRALLDPRGKPLPFESLSPIAIVEAILRWSALPGASRHHWGTDIDVYDASACAAGYKVQLTPMEVEAGGPFAPMHDWLDENMETFHFFRPYAKDRGGVSPERWHLSYEPLATDYLAHHTIKLLQETIDHSDMLLKELVLERLPEIYSRYVLNIDAPK